MKPSILIIDDDPDICNLLQKYLTKKNFLTDISVSATRAFDKLKVKKYDVVFCDYRLGDKDGQDVLTEIKKNYSRTEVIIITAYSDIKTAVNLIKSGAYDYMSKPLIPEELLSVTYKALERQKQKEEQHTVHAASPQNKRNSSVQKKDDFLKGTSPSMKRVYRQIELVAPTDYSVILHGESGCGKEVMAKKIHQKSNRKEGPFVALDCGVLTKELANSELFGHIKGSFTGAITDKKGHFELANGGTLFLDEVANLSYDIQAALLRVIQERKMKRIGSTKELNLDVRIIVASHEDLQNAYRKKCFREDLYYRLNEFSISIPPLRNRKKDIPEFAQFFLDRTNKETGKQVEGFDEAVIEKFLAYPWPGNIRELRNVIRKAVLLTPTGEEISVDALSSELTDPILSVVANEEKEDREKVLPFMMKHSKKMDLKEVSLEAEYQTIIEVLKSVDFNKSKAAKILNIDRKTLYNKIKERVDNQ